MFRIPAILKNLIRYLILLLSLLLVWQVTYAQPRPGMNVNGQPVVQGVTLHVCKGNSLLYTSTATNYTAINWQFHLGTPSASALPTPPAIVYNTVGTDSTIQMVTDGTDTVYFFIKIQVTDVHPVADFTFNNNVCSGSAQQFNPTVSGTAPFQYAWNFDVTGTSTLSNPVHTFTSLGCGTTSFSNTLIVTDATGCTDTVTHPITILQAPDVQVQDPGPIPFSNCQNSPTPEHPDFTLTINNTSPSSSCISSYTIDWGDGNSMPNAVFPATHTYTQIGAFNLIVTATGMNGCTNSVKNVVANQTNPAGSLGTLGTTTNLCAPATVPFTIENWQINSPGTLYQLNFGDGSSITLTHPLNPGLTKDTVYHTYTNSSCPGGSFTATLTVINACGSTPYTAGGIQVLKKAVSAFTVSATSFCVGQNVCFNNTTGNGFGPSCATTSTTTWDFGDGSPTSSEYSPCHAYAAPGIYTVTLTTSNYCGPSTVNMQICVTTPPVPGFTINNAEGCAPLNVATTNTTTSLNNCTDATYHWTVGYTPGFCGTTQSWDFTNGTTETSANPSFIFNNAGTYTITLSVTNPCGTFTTSKIISVKQPPQVTLTPVSNTCGTVTLTPAATVTACGTTPLVYAWTFGSGTPASSSNSDPGAITFSGAGSHTISLSVTNECGTTTKSEQFNIDTVSVADAGPPQDMCGTIATMAANTPVIGTGSWSLVSGPNNPAFTSPASPSTTVTGLIPGNYIFKWTIINGTCTSFSTVAVTIQTGPTPANAGPDQNLCLATSTTLAGNTPIVGTGVWTLTNGPVGYTITDPSSPTTTVTGLVPGVYTFQWTTSFNNCTPSSDNVQITVYESPTIADAGTNQTVCEASTITLAGNTPVTGTGAWSFVNGPNTPFITSPASPSTTVTGLIAGTYIFKWTINNGTCSSSSDVTILIQTGPTPANAGPDQNLCLATSTTLAGNTPSIGTGTWSFLSGPNGYTITDPSSPTTTVTGLVPGVYIFQWTTSFSSCTPSSDNVQISVYENPTVADAGADQTICASNVTIAGNTPVIGNGTWSSVSGPNNPVFTSPTSPSTTVTGLIPGTYVFKWKISNGVCTPSEDLVQVIVNPLPTTADAGTDQIVCAATTITLTGNTPTVGTGVWTFISGPNTPTITTPASSSTTVTGLIPGNYLFQWTITNGVCPPSNDQVQVINLNALQTQISSPVSSMCSGQEVTITQNNPTGGTGTYSYQWQQSSDGTTWSDIPSATSQNYTAILTDSVYIRCVVTSLPCQANSNEVFIAVQPSVSNNVITANQSICINTTAATITGNSPAGGDGSFTYQWEQSTDNGTTWTTVPGAVNADYSPGVLIQTTLYRRIVHTQLCSGPQANTSDPVTITVHQDSKALFTANPTISCAPFNLSNAITVTPFPDRDGQYQWLADESLFGTNTNGTFPGYIMSTPGDTVIIKLRTNSQYGCKPDSMEIQFITITTAIAGFTKTPASGCGPLSVAFTNTSSILDNSIQYFWNFGNGVLQTGMDPGSITFQNNPNHTDTTYHIILKAYNGCDTTYFRDSVTVFPDSKARFSVDTTRGCSPFTIHILNTSPGNNTAYYWDFGDGTTLTTATAGPLTHTYNTGAISTYVIQLISENQCSRDTQQITAVVSPNQIQAFVAANGNQLSGCAPHTVTFNNSSVGAAQLTWNFGDGTPIIITPNNQSSVIHTYANAGNYTITIHLNNDCSDTTIFRYITVYDAPQAAFDVNPLRACIGQTVAITNNSTNANSYEWFWGDGSPSTSTDVLHTYSSPGLFNITFVAKKVNPSGFTCTDTITKVVTVVDKIPAQITVAPGKPCAPYTLNVNAGNIAGFSLVKWIVYDSSTVQDSFEVTGLSATHVYTTPGTYSVKLVVYTTPTGCADSTTYQFSVYNTPKTTFSPELVRTCSHDTTLTFTAITTNNGSDLVNYKWFVNGSIEGTNNPFTHNFQAPLTNTLPEEFTIQALAENIAGCGDTSLAGKLIIQPLPYPHIEVSPSLVIQQPDYTFSFRDTVATSPNKTYEWNMGDPSLQTKNGQEITYEYADTGSYKVKLLVTDFSTGCKAYDSVTVTIQYIPGYLYVPNAMCLGCSNAGLRQFLPLAKGLKTYHLRIYNAWGQKLFETDKLDANGSPSEPWDGTVNGKVLQQDVYSWQIEATYINGTEWKGMLFPGSNKPIKAGFITIIK